MSSAEAEDPNRTNPKPRTGPRTNHGSPRSEIRPSRSQADLRSNRANRAPRARCAGPVALPRYNYPPFLGAAVLGAKRKQALDQVGHSRKRVTPVAVGTLLCAQHCPT